MMIWMTLTMSVALVWSGHKIPQLEVLFVWDNTDDIIPESSFMQMLEYLVMPFGEAALETSWWTIANGVTVPLPSSSKALLSANLFHVIIEDQKLHSISHRRISWSCQRNWRWKLVALCASSQWIQLHQTKRWAWGHGMLSIYLANQYQWWADLHDHRWILEGYTACLGCQENVMSMVRFEYTYCLNDVGQQWILCDGHLFDSFFWHSAFGVRC